MHCGAVLPPLPHLLGTAAVRKQRGGREGNVRDPSAQAFFSFFLYFPLVSFFPFPFSAPTPPPPPPPFLTNTEVVCAVILKAASNFLLRPFDSPFPCLCKAGKGSLPRGVVCPLAQFYLKSSSLDALRCSFHH